MTVLDGGVLEELADEGALSEGEWYLGGDVADQGVAHHRTAAVADSRLVMIELTED